MSLSLLLTEFEFTQSIKLMPYLTENGPLPRTIPETEIKAACGKFNLPLDTWRRQEHAFRLLKKAYAK